MNSIADRRRCRWLRHAADAWFVAAGLGVGVATIWLLVHRPL